ncbi:MAG TPA: hypothetical protein VLS49_13440 [Usitatibacter sp.]|nr:hypothetical protein [Usitatibacter sp.]
MKPTGEYQEKLTRDLIREERKIAKLKQELKDSSRAAREDIADHEAARDRLLDLLEGREHEQDELPLEDGASVKPRVRGPGLSVALSEAGAHIPAGEVKEAKAELARRGKRGKAAEAP